MGRILCAGQQLVYQDKGSCLQRLCTFGAHTSTIPSPFNAPEGASGP